MSDFKKIAQEAVELCKVYQAQIANLKDQLSMSKTASTVDKALAKKSVEALVKIGGLSEDQISEAQQILYKDHNACLRALGALCEQNTDANTLVKKESVDLNGGTLVGASKVETKPQQDAFSAMAKVLGLNMN